MDIINERISLALQSRIGKKYIKFPSKDRKSGIYHLAAQGKIGEEIELILSSKAVCANMQEDVSAFEAWSLILINYNIAKIIKLKWEEPGKKDNHYNRFIFRVYCFTQLFDWITIDSANYQAIAEFKGLYQNKLVVNEPSDNRDNNQFSQQEEAQLEKYIIENSAGNISKIIGLNLHNLERQFPVGLFKERVKQENRVFSGGKSAIDIYGVDYEERAIALFELKCVNNKKVGILSELLFYTMFIIEMLQNKFVYEQNKTNKIGKRIRIDEIDRVKACFLVNETHPLLDKLVINALNKAFKERITSITNNMVKEVSFLELHYTINQMDISFNY